MANDKQETAEQAVQRLVDEVFWHTPDRDYLATDAEEKAKEVASRAMVWQREQDAKIAETYEPAPITSLKQVFSQSPSDYARETLKRMAAAIREGGKRG